MELGSGIGPEILPNLFHKCLVLPWKQQTDLLIYWSSKKSVHQEWLNTLFQGAAAINQMSVLNVNAFVLCQIHFGFDNSIFLPHIIMCSWLWHRVWVTEQWQEETSYFRIVCSCKWRCADSGVSTERLEHIQAKCCFPSFEWLLFQLSPAYQNLPDFTSLHQVMTIT